MSVLIVLLGVSMLVAGGFLASFLWAVRTGQYNDKDTPTLRILFDDDDRRSPQQPPTQSP